MLAPGANEKTTVAKRANKHQTNHARLVELISAARCDKIVVHIKAAQPRLVNTVAGPNHHDKGSPLVMATQMVSLSQPYGNRSAALCTLARQKAIKAIKRQFQTQGVRLAHLTAREIHIFADACLAAHRDALIEEAIESVRKSPQLRILYEREQRRLRRS
jgi:hypothetical protein